MLISSESEIIQTDIGNVHRKDCLLSRKLSSFKARDNIPILNIQKPSMTIANIFLDQHFESAKNT